MLKPYLLRSLGLNNKSGINDNTVYPPSQQTGILTEKSKAEDSVPVKNKTTHITTENTGHITTVIKLAINIKKARIPC